MASEELQYNWDHADPTLVRNVPRAPRYHNGVRNPTYPTYGSILEIHPDIKLPLMIRERGDYWFTTSQNLLEVEEEKGLRDLENGIFYCFLEEEYSFHATLIMVRHGNVFMGDHWVHKIAAFPKDHPDADNVPYKMVNVSW